MEQVPVTWLQGSTTGEEVGVGGLLVAVGGGGKGEEPLSEPEDSGVEKQAMAERQSMLSLRDRA